MSEIVRFEAGHYWDEVPKGEVVTEAEAADFRDVYLAHNKYIPDVPDVFRTVKPFEQPPHIVQAAMQGVRAQVELHHTAAQAQLPAQTRLFQGAVADATHYFSGLAEMGEIPCDPDEIKSRMPNPENVRLMDAGAAYQDFSVDFGREAARKMLPGYLAWNSVAGSKIGLVTDHLRSTVIDENFIWLTGIHEAGHAAAGRTYMRDDEKGQRHVRGINVFAENQHRSRNHLGNRVLMDELIVEDMGVKGLTEFYGVPRTLADKCITYPLKATQKVGDFRLQYPGVHQTVLQAFFDNGSHGDVEVFDAKLQRAHQIMASVI